MNRSLRWTRILLGAGFLIALAAVARDLAGGCNACTLKLTAAPAVIGVCAYAALLAASLLAGPAAAVHGCIMAVATVHGLLVGHMIANGTMCLLCIAAAVNAGSLFIITLGADAANLLRAAFVVPVTALAATSVLGFPLAAKGAGLAEVVRVDATAPSSHGTYVDLVVFEKDDCPYCIELRQHLMPRVVQEFAGKIRVVYRDAADWPAISRTPTILIAAGAASKPSVIEGLPPYEMLRQAVANALAEINP